MQNDASVNCPAEPKAAILLVDDSPANLLALGAVLDDLGHDLVEARSGQEALRLLRDRDFAVVLLDVQMQGLDGFETARLIRGRERSRHTPIIFLTAHDENRLSVERAYALGAVDYLTKPLVPVILRAKVAGFVELHQKTEQVQRQAERLRQMERQDFERKLSEENARFRALTEHSSDAVALIGADGTVVYNSPSSRRVLGYEPDELLGHSGFEVIHPDDQQCVREGLAELVRGPGTSVTVEVRARHKDGTWRWVECVSTNLLGEPAVGAVVVNFRDITERKAAADALRDSEERFRQLAENINAVFWMSDPHKAQILYVSPAYEAIWGRSCRSLYEQSRSFLDAIHPDDRGRVVAESLERQARGEASDVEYRVVRPDGSVRWVRDRGFPVRDAAGRVYRVAGIAEDVTERKQAVEALRDSEQRFARFMQHLPGLAWVKDREGRYAYVNDAAERAFGRRRADLHGQTDDQLFPPQTAALFRANDRRALDSGTAAQVIETLTHPDGSLHHSLVSKFPIPGPGGEAALVGGVAIDVTDRVEMEAELQEANRRKDEFLAMLGHELRNPLAPIRNAIQIMKLLGPLEPNLSRARDMIERQVQHLARLVDDLLDVSRITRGKVRLDKEPVELATVVARAVETSHPAIDARRHRLSVTLPPDPVLVEGDVTRLAQVVANLLHNAAKYTGEGGHIRLAVERQGDEALVRVGDDGMGIPADLLPRVFDLFTQGDRSLARSEGGLGIGLTLVRSLVELHGGRVEAHSDGPGRGSEFVVRLPILERRHGRAPRGREANAAAPPAVARRILVVDDNADAAESLALILKVAGHEVRTAHDGAAALQAAAEFRPEAVLLDIGLPRMDGYEVARRLREQVGLNAALLVALTGYGADEDRRRAREAGFDAHMVKPADPAALQALLASDPRTPG